MTIVVVVIPWLDTCNVKDERGAGSTSLLKVTQASQWNVDYARLVGPHSYRSFTCTALYHHFGSMQCVCTVIFLQLRSVT